MRGHALYARLGAVGRGLPTGWQQARALGISVKQLKYVRYRARLAGFDVGELEPDYSARAPRLAEVDREMAGAGCPVCKLRGPHVCLPETARLLMTNRNGGFVSFLGKPGGRTLPKAAAQ